MRKNIVFITIIVFLCLMCLTPFNINVAADITGQFTSLAADMGIDAGELCFNKSETNENGIDFVYDFRNRLIGFAGNVSSTLNRNVVLMVIKPGYSYEDYIQLPVEDKAKAIAHLSQGTFNDERYCFLFEMNGESGEYTAIIKNGGIMYTSKFKYFNLSSVDDYTTTYYKPWMLNYHMTDEEELFASKKGGEAGQMMWSLGYAPSNPNVIYMGTDTSGMWKSTDGGTSWLSINTGFEVFGTVSLAVNPENENEVFVLAFTHASVLNNLCGIYKTEDGGATWRIIKEIYYKRDKANLMIYGTGDENDRRTLYIGGQLYDMNVYTDNKIQKDGLKKEAFNQGVLSTNDGGLTWNKLGLEQYNVFKLISNNGVLIAATGDGIFKYNKAASTWSQMNNGLGTDLNIRSIAAHPVNNNILYCNSLNNLYKSVDGGASWVKIRTLTDPDIATKYVDSNSAFCRISFSAPDEQNSARLYLVLRNVSNNFRYFSEEENVFKKAAAIKNNTALDKTNVGYGGEPIAIHPTEPGTLLISLNGVVYKSTDGGVTLSPSSSQFSGMKANDFWFNPDDPNDIFFSTIDWGAFRTKALGLVESYPVVDYSPMNASGIRYNGNKTTHGIARDPDNHNRFIVGIGSWSTCILKESRDGGKTWAVLSDIEIGKAPFIAFNEHDTDNEKIIYAGSLISYDDGLTWQILLFDNNPEKPITISGMDPSDNNLIYGVYREKYATYSTDYLLISRDAGRTWTNTSKPIGGYQKFTCFNENGENLVYIGGFTNGYRRYNATTGNMTTFSGVNNFGINDYVSIYQVAIDPKNSKHLVAGGSGSDKYKKPLGLFESFDKGQSWTNVSGVAGSADIFTVEYHPTLPRVYIGTSAGTFVYECEKNPQNQGLKLISQNYSTGNGNLTNTLELLNPKGTKENFTCYMIVKNENSIIKKVSAANKSLDGYQSDTFSFNIDISELDNADTVCTYLWRSQGLNPLISAMTYKMSDDTGNSN